MIDLFNKKRIKQLEELLHERYEDKEYYKEKLNELTRSENRCKQLYEENEKLIEWIKQILENFGTFDVYDTSPVKIPVWKQSSMSYDPATLTRTYTDTKIIPQIVIHTIKNEMDR